MTDATLNPTTPDQGVAPTVTLTGIPTEMTVDVRGTPLTVNLVAMQANGALMNCLAYGVTKRATDAHANAGFDAIEAWIRDGKHATIKLDKDAKAADVKKAVEAAKSPFYKAHDAKERVAARAVALAQKWIAAWTAPAWTGDEPFPIVLTGRDAALADVLSSRKVPIPVGDAKVPFASAPSAARRAFTLALWDAYDKGTAKAGGMALCTEALESMTKPTIDTSDLF